MRINVLQHAPNEGPGAIRTWAHRRGAQMFVYHPDQFGILPSAEQTDMLVLLGGPMSPNDDLPWIKQERQLIQQLLQDQKPLFGACFGAQQLAKTLGAKISNAPYKEVGWAPVYRQTDLIPGLPKQVEVLHWHEQMFAIPDQARRLFASDLVKNQGFVYGKHVVGLQFHFEPLADNLREIVVNDGQYALEHNALHQTPAKILQHGVPAANETVMFQLLDYITQK